MPDSDCPNCTPRDLCDYHFQRAHLDILTLFDDPLCGPLSTEMPETFQAIERVVIEHLAWERAHAG